MAIKKTSTRTPTRGMKIDFMKATNNIGKPIAAVAGFAVGKYALKRLSKSEAVTGLIGVEMKDYLVPVAVTMGGLIATQMTKNQYIQLGLVGAAGAGVEAMIKKATGKTILQGLEGLIGNEYYEDAEILAINPITQELPAADIDIEREIQESMSGASDFSMSDEPIGSTATDYAMSDDPIGSTDNNYEEEAYEVDKITGIEPDSMDYDIFSGDMMES